MLRLHDAPKNPAALAGRSVSYFCSPDLGCAHATEREAEACISERTGVHLTNALYLELQKEARQRCIPVVDVLRERIAPPCLQGRPTRVRLARPLEEGKRYDETVRTDAEVAWHNRDRLARLEAENDRLKEHIDQLRVALALTTLTLKRFVDDRDLPPLPEETIEAWKAGLLALQQTKTRA